MRMRARVIVRVGVAVEIRIKIRGKGRARLGWHASGTSESPHAQHHPICTRASTHI